MGTKSCTKILNFSTRVSLRKSCRRRFRNAPYTRYYGDKILYKNPDLTQDFPTKILFHSLWEQNLVQNLPKIFRLPEMYSFGKILAQDFQMAAVTKILMRRENQLRRFFPWGISDKQKTENT